MAEIVMTIGDLRLAAEFESNSTSETLLGRLPFTLPMLDLYGHELVHRFEQPLPTTNLVTRAPRRGDIVYWSPRNSLAIFYGDGDEDLSDLQMIGRVDAGIDRVNHPGDSTVTFERAAH